jgi:tripartite-type tricarboxylate transporter receptor subunit TctC
MEAPTAAGEIDMLARWAATAALIAYAGAGAAAYPERPVRLIVPAASGGAIDVVGRIVGAKLTDVLGPECRDRQQGGREQHYRD